MRISSAILLSALLLGGCTDIEQQEAQPDTQEAQPDVDLQEDEEASFMQAEPVNPCVDSAMIDSIKQGMRDKAYELIRTKSGGHLHSKLNQDMSDGIFGADITFSNIYASVDGGCDATVTISYYGNEKTSKNIMSDIAILMNKNIPQTYTAMDITTGFMLQKSIEELYVNRLNIKNLTMDGKSASGSISYHTQEYFSEDGTTQNGWQAHWGIMPNMLAAVVFYDVSVQEINRQLKLGQKLQKQRQQQVEEQAESDIEEQNIEEQTTTEEQTSTEEQYEP